MARECKCQACERDFVSERRTARYCSNACRQRAFRRRRKSANALIEEAREIRYPGLVLSDPALHLRGKNEASDDPPALIPETLEPKPLLPRPPMPRRFFNPLDEERREAARNIISPSYGGPGKPFDPLPLGARRRRRKKRPTYWWMEHL